MNAIFKKSRVLSFVLMFLLNYLYIHAQNTVEVTYIANEGFFLSGGNKNVLIDAMFSEDYNQFHVPSADDANQNNLTEFKNLNLAEENIDVAFIPYWIYESPSGREIIKYINAKAIVLMHIPVNKIANYKNSTTSYDNMPPVHFFESIMEKTVILKNSDNNIFISDTIRIDDNSSGNEVTTSFSINKYEGIINIYPNPTSDFLIVNVPDNLVGDKIQLFDIASKLVYFQDVNKNQINVDFPGHIKAGIYLLKVGEISNKIIFTDKH